MEKTRLENLEMHYVPLLMTQYVYFSEMYSFCSSVTKLLASKFEDVALPLNPFTTFHMDKQLPGISLTHIYKLKCFE